VTQGQALKPRSHTVLSEHTFLCQGTRRPVPWREQDRGAEAPPSNPAPPSCPGLPTPALHALCKLITASETGEQLISRVSGPDTEPRQQAVSAM
jgi:hypothetical protein